MSVEWNDGDAIKSPYPESLPTVMSNADHTIEEDVAARLKTEEASAQYSGWNFCGCVWWDRTREKWACEVWRYHEQIATVIADTLQEIMDEVSERCGYD